MQAKAKAFRQAQGRRRRQAQAQTPPIVQPVRLAQALWSPVQEEAPGPEPHVYSLETFLQQRAAAAAPAPVEQEAVDDGMVNAKNLVRRLIAAVDALQDIPRHAMRLARWQAQPKEERRPERWSPLRPGRPPGFRQRAKHEVDEILKECHWLALEGNPPLDDTS